MYSFSQLAAMSMLGCHTSADQFYGEIFLCDPAAPTETCGTTRDGHPMTCFNGRGLNGQSFCTAQCDPAASPPDPQHACSASGALLQRCHPTASHRDQTQGCPAGLQCLRTRLDADEGVCTTVPVCVQDSDCAGQQGTICAGSLVSQVLSVPVYSDNLYCIQPTCQTSTSECPSDQACLMQAYGLPRGFPDLCVPRCNSGPCPPGFACAMTPYAPGSPPFCLPGLPGTRCTAAQDCMIGDCVDAGAGFSACETPCASNADCIPLNSVNGTFQCVPAGDGPGHCVAAKPLQGPSCVTDADCAAGLRCYTLSPYMTPMPAGECRLSCNADGSCPARAGIPHVCTDTDTQPGGCYPANFGLACTMPFACIGDLSCQPITPDRRYPAGGTVCTTSCTGDTDCDADSWTEESAFCQDGYCHMGFANGTPCTRDHECLSRICAPDGAGGNTCIEMPRPQ